MLSLEKQVKLYQNIQEPAGYRKKSEDTRIFKQAY